MLKLLRVLGFIKHTAASNQAERERQLHQTDHEIDLLAIHLDQVRGEMQALRQRRARLFRQVNEYRNSNMAIDVDLLLSDGTTEPREE